ncbi:TPA: hypothetical protein ENX78_07155 [Candidatus Poribacteria bacterium]|nr:hypothetical protein [Candidatus Poribacteria bacterium]
MENNGKINPQNLGQFRLLSESLTELDELKKIFEELCSKIAKQYSLYYENGKPRKSTLIETIARSPCLTCITKSFSNKTATKNVDSLYKECHRLAVNVLVEELYRLLNTMGYKVLISAEAELEYGKADILITVTNYGLNLKGETRELLIEVKTGNSVSLTQIFRYLLDFRSDTIIVWRIRKRQVLVFNAQKIKPLLAEFMRIICLRADRLLSSQRIQPCQHTKQSNYQPSQEELEKMFEEFSSALIETLPTILQTTLEQLEIVIPSEQGENCEREK